MKLEIKGTQQSSAKVVRLDNFRPIEGADRIQIAVVDFQEVVVSKEMKEGDVVIYFPVETQINPEFLSYTNSYRDKLKNRDTTEAGFFGDKGRVKAINLMKGTVKSCGYIVPIEKFQEFFKVDLRAPEYHNTYFDTLNGDMICKKFVVQNKQQGEKKVKQGKKPRISRLVDGQVHLHVNTSNLRQNSHKIRPEDTISITYKTHGTSWWVGNVKVKRKMTLIHAILRFFGVSLKETVYDIVYGSRRVVKNEYLEDDKRKDHFFGYDLWRDIKDEVADKIPKGYTLYGECIGFDKNGGYIQKGYDYKCKPHTFKLEVYRITFTNEDGLVSELTYPQIEEFCKNAGLTPSLLYFYGKAGDWFSLKRRAYLLDEAGQFPVVTPSFINVSERDLRTWQEKFVRDLEYEYNEKDCFMCENSVPEEGVVIRKESLFNCESYKLKSKRFLVRESSENDKGVVNIEDTN